MAVVMYKDDIPIVHTYAQLGMPVIHAEDYATRLERRLEFEDKNHKVANVIAVRERPEGPRAIKEQFLGGNLVTDHGEQAYAEKASTNGVTSTINGALIDFWSANSRFQVRDNATPLTPAETDTYTQFTNPVAGSLKTRVSGYPLAGTDADGDNTGDTSARVVSWAVNYSTTDFSATNISGLVIVPIASPVTTGGGTPLLNHSAFTAFAKASTDTLKFFVCHDFAGA